MSSPALRAGFYPLTRARKTFEIIPGFTPETHLDAKAQLAYHSHWWWVDHLFKLNFVPLSQGLQMGSITSRTPKGVPLKDGQMHAKNMREVGHIVMALGALLERYGDPRAARRLDEVWGIVLSRAATGFGKEAALGVFTRTVAGKSVDMEQAGLLRFNYQFIDSGTPPKDGKVPPYIDTDHLHVLDLGLQFATVGLSGKMFHDNLAHGFGNAYARVRRLEDDLYTRLEFLSATLKPDLDWWGYLHTLRHHITSRYVGHLARFATTGEARHAEAAAVLGRWLADDVEMLTLSDGNVVALQTHQVQAAHSYNRYSEANRSLGYQDITYKREDAPVEVFASTLPGSVYTDEYLAASARTTHLLVLSSGPNGPTISATVGGNGPAEYAGQHGVFYGGKWHPGRFKNGRLTSTEMTMQVSRGQGTINSAWAKDHAEFEENLVILDKRKDGQAPHYRYGSRTGLLYYASPQRLEAV